MGDPNGKVKINDVEDSLERDVDFKPSEPEKQMVKPVDGSLLKSSKRLQALKLGDIYKLIQID